MHLPPHPSPTVTDPLLMYSPLRSSSPISYPSISSLPASSLLHALSLPPNLPSHQLQTITGFLHPITLINLSTTTRLVLKTAPSPHTPLLRHERLHIASEAKVLALLAKSALPLPRLLKHNNIHSTNSCLLWPYLLTTHLPGISYALARPYLTHSERQSIESQIFSILTTISSYTSPRYGPVALVAEGKGYSSWKEAFSSMLDSLLMDAEDMLVALPYGEIRYVLEMVGPELEQVTEASLIFGLGVNSHTSEEIGDGERKLGSVEILIDRRSNEITGLVGLGGAVWGDATCGVRGGTGKAAL